MASYDNLDRDTLIRLLHRRDAERQLGLVWERDEIEADAAINDDFVALDLDGTKATASILISSSAWKAAHTRALQC